MIEGLVLGRIGHYCFPNPLEPGRPQEHTCYAGLITCVGEGGTEPTVNLTIFRPSGETDDRAMVRVSNEPLGDLSTFHLTYDCPWGR